MVEDLRDTAALHRVKQGYTTGARTLASRSIVGLARTRVTPNALTTAGVSLCLGASVLVFFEYRHELLFYWLGAFVFVVGSVLDIVDGRVARAYARHGRAGRQAPGVRSWRGLPRCRRLPCADPAARRRGGSRQYNGLARRGRGRTGAWLRRAGSHRCRTGDPAPVHCSPR